MKRLCSLVLVFIVVEKARGFMCKSHEEDLYITYYGKRGEEGSEKNFPNRPKPDSGITKFPKP